MSAPSAQAQGSSKRRLRVLPRPEWHPRFVHPALSETQLFLILALLIGIFSGLLVVLFHISIDLISWSSLGPLSGKFRFTRLLAPTIGAILATLIVRHLFPRARGSGVNQTKVAIYTSNGYVSSSTIAGKFAACAVSIGSGNSLGPEDPSLQMGAGVASWLGRMFQLPRNSMRLIAPVGAAAGIAAAFNTPISGVLFVMEEVLADWSATAVGSIVLAAVSSVVTMRAFLGSEPLFRVPPFQLANYSELIVYAGVGVVGGAVSALFIWLIERLKRRIHRCGSWRYYVLPPLAGLLTGAVGLWFPEIMGAGYDALNSALHGQFTWQLLLFIGVAKLFATLIAFSADTPGGMFAPALFIGGMLGGAMGGIAHRWWPYGSANAEAYMLVGMGTFFAGVFRAPITSIFMVFESSASYMIILPVMVANTTAYLISRKLHPTPFFTMLAELEGANLPSAEEKRNFQMLRVEDAMRPLAAPEDVRPGVRLYPDEPLDAALRLLADQPRIQIVSRLRPDEVLASLTLEDVHHAYHIMETHGVQTGAANEQAG